MAKPTDVLKLRTLLCFLRQPQGIGTVTGIARTLGEEKYTVSRLLASMEQEGLVDRSNNRTPHLTGKGMALAHRYEERIDTSVNHLLFQGVDAENARQDGLYWALYCSDQTMETIREAEARHRLKYDLRSRKQFGGSLLCKRLEEGSYSFPFLLYPEHGNVLSPGIEAFEHPCTLLVRQGVGRVQLRSVGFSFRSSKTGREIRGKVQSLQYREGDCFYAGEQTGDLFSFPASALHFVNVGQGAGQMLHGSVLLRLSAAGEELEESVVFTVLI